MPQADTVQRKGAQPPMVDREWRLLFGQETENGSIGYITCPNHVDGSETTTLTSPGVYRKNGIRSIKSMVAEGASGWVDVPVHLHLAPHVAPRA